MEHARLPTASLRVCVGAGGTFRRGRYRSDGPFDEFWRQWSLPASGGTTAAGRCCSRNEDTSRASTDQWRAAKLEGTFEHVEVCLGGSLLRRSGKKFRSPFRSEVRIVVLITAVIPLKLSHTCFGRAVMRRRDCRCHFWSNTTRRKDACDRVCIPRTSRKHH